MKALSRSRAVLSASQALFTFIFLLLFFTLLNGYGLNLVSGYQANTWLVLGGLILELLLTLYFARSFVTVAFDPLELAGFILVATGVWVYFVSASFPTLLPPTQSVDAVRHYLQAMFSYPKGTLVSWYPAAGAFIAATASHWLGAAPLRILHPLASAYVALTAGATYGITCALLPPRRISKIAALAAPALLFFPWSYFAGIIDWEQYYYAQALAQLFVIAALWYIVSFAGRPHWTFLALLGAAVLCTAAAYPYLVGLPVALFAIVILVRFALGHPVPDDTRRMLVTLGLMALLLVLFGLALEQGGILEFRTFGIATQGDVGEGGVTNPSLDTLGGPFFLLLALIGLVPAWRAGAQGRTLVGFFGVWLLQLGALLILQPLLQVSGYRVDKTFYVLVYPLAILGALVVGWVATRWSGRVETMPPAAAAGLAATAVVLGLGIAFLRPPKAFSPLSESEIETALWAKDHLDTYQVHVLDAGLVRAYWLTFGLWGERVPNDWFVWIPAGPKLGPPTVDAWINDSAWAPWLFVRDISRIAAPLPTIAYRNGDAAILVKPTPVSFAPAPSHPSAWHYEDVVKVLGYDLPKTTYAPGETVRLSTYAESIHPPAAAVIWRAEVTDYKGNVVSKDSHTPFADKYPLQRWPPGRSTVDEWRLPLDAMLAPGIYNLQLGLYRQSDGAMFETRAMANEDIGLAYATLARIKIPPAPPSENELTSAVPAKKQFGDQFSLLAYTLHADTAARTVRLILYWRDLQPAPDYTVFVHLLDSSGAIVTQKDAQPLDGAYPTSAWDAGETVKTEYVLTIPAGAPEPAKIELGMYDSTSQKRLAVDGGDAVVIEIR